MNALLESPSESLLQVKYIKRAFGIDLENLCRICNNLYLISATNKKNLVEIVNSYNGVNDDSYIFNIIPADAIEDNIICAPISFNSSGVSDFTVA